ncbi:MAG TPA: hypothetical protein ENG11_01410 [candidate division Zixibacteria bacterium]|nr:hypothetical protein [candidate division Zixibacteria bacterium]
MRTRQQYLDERNRKIQKLYKYYRKQGYTAKKCFEEIAKLTRGELSPATVKRIVYTYVPLSKRKQQKK